MCVCSVYVMCVCVCVYAYNYVVCVCAKKSLVARGYKGGCSADEYKRTRMENCGDGGHN